MVVRKEYENIESMVCDALDICCESSATFIAKYDSAVIILKELLGYEEFVPFLIDISDPLYSGYDREFIITVNDNDEVFCEKFYRNNKYIIPNDGVIFITLDCSDECVSYLYKYTDRFFIEVGFDEGVECCDSCDYNGSEFTNVVPCLDDNDFTANHIVISIHYL